MKYYKDVLVSGTASIESLETLLTGTEAERIHVEALAFMEDTDTEQIDADLRAYRNLEKFIDMSIRNLVPEVGNDTRAWNPWLEVDIQLDPGDKLEVGHVSGATASDIRVVARYTVGRR